MSLLSQMIVQPLGFPWPTEDPFLFCAHHLDLYPPGNEHLEVAADLSGRVIGQDFLKKDGWRMYHGTRVPGFPVHPHRGFETITIARQGFIDHSDSMGAFGRFGQGDVQWMTAGRGIQHSEMFPMLNAGESNPMEIFQIWLNLPANNKMVDPHFRMMWSEEIPEIILPNEDFRSGENSRGRAEGARLRLVAGNLDDQDALRPPPASWAAMAENQVQIWMLEILPHSRVHLPAAGEGNSWSRNLYFYEGEGAQLRVNKRPVPEYSRVQVPAENPVTLETNGNYAMVLVLEGRPLDEPIARHGPFVMNTGKEIFEAIQDYQSTEFGNWNYGRPDPVHGPDKRRFARYPDGSSTVPPE